MSDQDLRAVEAHEDELARRGEELDKLAFELERAIRADPDQIGQYLTSQFNDDLNSCRVACRDDAARFLQMYDELLDAQIKAAADRMARREIANRITCVTSDKVRDIYAKFCGWRQ